VTAPLPAFFGEAAVPTTVDVFSGGARLFEQDVPPGPFELRNLPVVTGAGSATVVTTDVLGRESTQSLSLYTTADLLAPGLTSFVFDAGFLRRGYGQESFAYDMPLLSATVRHGVGDTVTLEGHAEAARGLGMLGLGAATGIGAFGAISLDGAASTSAAGTGGLAAASFQAGGGALTVFGSLVATSGAFRDLASLDGALLPRLRYQLGVSAGIGRGSVSLNWVGSKPYSGRSNSFLSGSYAQNWRDGTVLSLTALHDLVSGQWSLQAALTVTVSDGYASLSALDTAGQASAQALYERPVDPDGGFGYRVSGEGGDVDRAEASASYLGQRARLDGDIALNDGKTALRASADGALVAIDGALFATRDTGGAVALVDAGQEGVRVYRENRPVAVSDADGQALLTDLDPDADNHISVEPRDYPMAATLPDTNRVVTPKRRSGIVVDFAPVSLQPVFVTIETADHLAPPAGTRVELLGSPTALLMGHDGRLFIPDLKSAGTLAMTVGGKRCLARVEPQTGAAGFHGDALQCIEAGDAG
jgi:outer membrane usher protein